MGKLVDDVITPLRRYSVCVMADVSQILSDLVQGDPSAANQLLPLVYEELRKLAAVRLANEKPGQTLQATALVHEAYVRLVDNPTSQHWDGRGHFFAAAAESMRRILVERARKKNRLKRGGDRVRVDLLDHDLMVDAAANEVLAVDDALERLGQEDPLASKVLELKYYGGLSIDEAATALNVSRATAYRHWTYARAWVRAELLDDKS
jgi:RNA polymerase sigma factor (TIGR02999 family)